MAGGNWTTQNKVRPGAYINVMSDTPTRLDAIRGIVAMPFVGGWGSGEIIEVNARSNFNSLLGYGLNAPELLTIHEALKQATLIILKRINVGDGAKAKATTTDGLNVIAKYEGIRGNDISVRITENVNNTMLVQTLLDARIVDEQLVADLKDLNANDFVDFDGSGTHVSLAGVRLAGGVTAPITIADYISYFEAMEVKDFNTMALPSEDELTKQLAIEFIKSMRSEQGKKCQLVVSGMSSPDNEAVINVVNGVVLSGDVDIPPHSATAWVAGATAGADVNQSNTYAQYEGAVDVLGLKTHLDIETALSNGEFLFDLKDGRVLVEQDINSLTTFTRERSRDFRKNRVLRVLDDISNTTRRIYSAEFIGSVTNNQDGRDLFRARVGEYLEGLQEMGAIEYFSIEDLQIEPGEEKDSVVANLKVQPTDAMEKLYMTVTVQ